MRLRKGSVLLACALVALLALAAASAAAARSKKPKKPVAAKVAKKPVPKGKTTKPRAMCQLGQNTLKPPCAPNPLFAKDVCSDYLSQVQALAAPGTRIATAGNRYGPSLNVVGCYYTANGTPQRFYFRVYSGGTQSHAQQDLERDYQESVSTYTYTQCPPSEPEPTAPGVVKTTIERHEAFTVDQCAPIDNGVVQPTAGIVEVLAGNDFVLVGGGGRSFGSLTSSQLIPFAEALIAKYHWAPAPEVAFGRPLAPSCSRFAQRHVQWAV